MTRPNFTFRKAKRMSLRPIHILLALLIVSTGALAQEVSPPAKPKKQYVYKNDGVRLGTNIPTDMTVTDHPIDVPYDELTPEQKASWKSQYLAMPADDEPPYPVVGLKRTMKAVLKAAQRSDSDGEVDAVVVVRDDGTPDSVSILKAPTQKLGTFVAQALMLEKFKPAKCAGKPCAMEFPFQMRIVLTR